MANTATMTARALCRRLSLRSKLGFGTYHFCGIEEPTVGEILEQKGGRDYLLWIYYHKVNIDFLPEVLDKLNAPQIISKPGMNPQLFDSVRAEQKEKEKARRSALTPEQRAEEDSRRRKKMLKELKLIKLSECAPMRYYQAINHGHMPQPNPKEIWNR